MNEDEAVTPFSVIFLYILQTGWLDTGPACLTAAVSEVAKRGGVDEEYISTVVWFYQQQGILDISTDGRIIQIGLDSYCSTYRSASSRRVVGRGRMLRILEAFNCTCFYCGRTGSISKCPDGRHWHVDHKVALARGGTDDDDNLALSCARCNTSKGTRTAPKTLAGRVS